MKEARRVLTQASKLWLDGEEGEEAGEARNRGEKRLPRKDYLVSQIVEGDWPTCRGKVLTNNRLHKEGTVTVSCSPICGCKFTLKWKEPPAS